MNNNMQGIKGYKVFNHDWTCRGYQYEVGKIFKENVTPQCCSAGFHFCLTPADCFRYYKFDPNNKVAEVIALGMVDYREDDSKVCTDKIKIIREIPWDEVLRIVNIGKDCTGFCNTRDWNTGDWNTGNCNTGDWNTGNCNTGDWNTGNCNTGNCNTGNCNTGNCNTGNCNTGDWNTGDWNIGSCNTGCFITEEQNIPMFNKPSDWSYRDWINSDAKQLLDQMPKNTKWVHAANMSEEEKTKNPTYKTTVGYLKLLNRQGYAQIWWDELSESDRQIIKDLPNFDADIFEQCTGIRVEKIEKEASK